jgi:hypothetical protein
VTCLHTNRPGHIWTTLYLHPSRPSPSPGQHFVYRFCIRISVWLLPVLERINKQEVRNDQGHTGTINFRFSQIMNGAHFWSKRMDPVGGGGRRNVLWTSQCIDGNAVLLAVTRTGTGILLLFRFLHVCDRKYNRRAGRRSDHPALAVP